MCRDHVLIYHDSYIREMTHSNLTCLILRDVTHQSYPQSRDNWGGYDWWAPKNYRSLLQNIVSFIGLVCKRDLCF